MESNYRLIDRDDVIGEYQIKADAVREAKRLIADREVETIDLQQRDDAQGLTGGEWFTVRSF